MIVERLRARCFIHTVFAVALLAGNVASPDNCIAQSDISMKVAAPQGVAALPDPADTGDIGVRIDSSNAQLYKKIFLAPIYDLVRSGSLAIDAASQLKYSLHGDDDWIEQSKKLAERGLKLDKQGALSADFPMVRGFLFGTSTALLREFEEANTKNQEKGEEEKSLIQDDKLAYKLLWNLQSQLTSLGLIQMNFAMIWIENNRLARQASGNFARVYPSVLDSGYSAEQFFREKIVFEFPRPLKDYTWLTFRFKGADEDRLWVYSPVNKKKRQLVGSNRSDLLALSSVAPDDFFGWSGKINLVSASVVDHSVALTPFPSPELRDLSGTPGACSLLQTGKSLSSFSTPTVVWNYETKRFPSAAGWVPSNAVFVPRDLWRIELSSRDPYSLVGRQTLYIDTETMLPAYKIVYDRAGRLWKTVISSFGFAASDDRSRQLPFPAFLIVIDHLNGTQNGVSFSKVSFCNAYPDGIALEQFAPSGLGGEIKDNSAEPPKSE